jgi:hypothetical protein
MTVITFTVKDSITGTSVADAYVHLVCNFAGGGTIPYDGHSDANGVVSIDINRNTPVLYWSVEKSGYQKASGSGTPPSIVNLEPTTSPPGGGGTPPEVPSTYIVYDSDLSDKRSAELIAEKRGFTLLQTSETKDPSVYDPLYDDNNIVCVGGGLLGPDGKPVANAYSYYYFPMRRGSDGLLYGQFGISADGRRIIATKRRANGTTVTIVSGIDESDTWRAANEYCKEPVSPLVPVGVIAAAMGGAYAVMKVKR